MRILTCAQKMTAASSALHDLNVIVLKFGKFEVRNVPRLKFQKVQDSHLELSVEHSSQSLREQVAQL